MRYKHQINPVIVLAIFIITSTFNMDHDMAATMKLDELRSF